MSAADKQFAACMLLVFALFVILVVIICYRFHKKLVASKKLQSLNEQVRGAASSGSIQHLSGLPFGKDVFIKVYCYPDKFVFVNGGQEAILERKQILSADTTIKRGRKVRGFPEPVHIDLNISYMSNNKSKNIRLRGNYASKLLNDIRSKPIRSHSSAKL